MISTGVERGDEVWEEYQAICPLALPILIVLHLSPFLLLFNTYHLPGFLGNQRRPRNQIPQSIKEGKSSLTDILVRYLVGSYAHGEVLENELHS